VVISYSEQTITTHLIGLYNANNINAAIAIGRCFGVTDDAIKEALENYIPENNRSQLISKGTNEIILDAYNANPSSMKVAIENFILLDKVNKIAFLGDMFELGKESLIEHQNVVDLLADQNDIVCYFIGKDFYQNKTSQSNFFFFETFDSFSNSIKDQTFQNNMILIKGSRGMALERTLEFIK
jgi:UDP-N-acetylmuramoyl-tripeptide--D-alanyl-D-alanine ligase